MKRLSMAFIGPGLVLVLAGCATEPYGPGHGAHPQPRDPTQWRVVSVTPVAAGTAARVAAASADGKAVEHSSRPVTEVPPAYSQAPAYTTAPLYPPVYVPPYAHVPAFYWPPVTFSLGFVFGRHWGGGHRRWRR